MGFEYRRKEEDETESAKGMKKINPLRDFTIVCNEHRIEIKKGEKIEVPQVFLDNLKTEKVIK